MPGSHSFKVGNLVVYPAHGVGEIIGEETQIIGGCELRVFIISILKERMVLRVPVKRASVIGLRQLSTPDQFQGIFSVFQKRSRSSKGMWSKRAQEYELKINSGDVNSLAEVVRDLFKNSSDPDRSYSERVIYESALNRLASEFAAIEGIAIEKALSLLTQSLEEKELVS